MDAAIRVWRCDGCGEMLPGPYLDLDMARCKCRTGQWRVCSVAATIGESTERARKAEQERDDLAAANLAANKRIEELEHERDAARAELARLTTPRPIAEAPRDGTRILAYMPSTETWMVLVWLVRKECWACPDFPHVGYYDPAEYLPLPEVKP
jgi:hypothetical protein